MILPIYAYGHPILRKETQEIEELNTEIKTLISNMFETIICSHKICYEWVFLILKFLENEKIQHLIVFT